MIGKLTGHVDTILKDSIILDISGVGYHVYGSAKTLQFASDSREKLSLLIETHVREDHIHLYGFWHESERDWFNILTTVKGVGAKLALTILGSIQPDYLTTVIASGDKAAFKSVSGVGPKLAERLITELKSHVSTLAAPNVTKATSSSSPTQTLTAHHADDAITALVQLGYNRSDAYHAIMKLTRVHEGATAEALIRHGLKELAS